MAICITCLGVLRWIMTVPVSQQYNCYTQTPEAQNPGALCPQRRGRVAVVVFCLFFSQLQHSRINHTQTVVLELEDNRTESVFCCQKRLFPVVLNTFLLNYLLYFCFHFDNILNAELTCNSSLKEFRYQYQVCPTLSKCWLEEKLGHSPGSCQYIIKKIDTLLLSWTSMNKWMNHYGCGGGSYIV